jgi:hypothetical protein
MTHVVRIAVIRYFCYPFHSIYRAKLVKDYMSEFPTTLRIASMNYDFHALKIMSEQFQLCGWGHCHLGKKVWVAGCTYLITQFVQ